MAPTVVIDYCDDGQDADVEVRADSGAFGTSSERKIGGRGRNRNWIDAQIVALALPDFAGSAVLVAVTATAAGDGTTAGAV